MKTTNSKTFRLYHLAAAVLLMLSCFLLSNAGPVQAAAPKSGKCGAKGSNVTWSLSKTGVLTISGRGKMKDFITEFDPETYMNATAAPWGSPVQDVAVKKIIIKGSVTYIGKNAFLGCRSLTQVTMNNSITSPIRFYEEQNHFN